MQIEKKFYNEKHRPYYICAPGYARVSNGVRAMHLLCHYLNKLGEEAYIFTPGTEHSLRTPYLTQEIFQRHQETNRSPIVIYPEVVHGNPFRASAVVRYILNHPGLLGGPKEFDESDMLVFWHQDYVDAAKYVDPSFIFIPSIDTAIFNNEDNAHDADRQKVLIYPGRYHQAKEEFPELFQGAEVITYQWPESHEELAALLRQGKVLYTFANSAIISEALLCGCPVVIKETVFSKKPDERAGVALGLALPGATFDDTPEGIETARGKVEGYQQVYHQYQLELLQQLEAFIEESQQLPKGNVADFVFPIAQPVAAPPVSQEQASYDAWMVQHELKPWHAQVHAERMMRGWSSQPSFIMLMPLTADRLPAALKTVASLSQQLYKQWQLIIVADFDAPGGVFESDVLGWLRIDDARDPAQLTQAYAAVLEALPCDWISILPAGSELEIHAMLSLGDYAALHPEWQAVYSDSDTMAQDGKRCHEAFRPDFNLDYLRGTDYIGAAAWFRREAVQASGGLAQCPGADGYDALLRIRDNGGAIGHIAEPLLHLPPHAEGLSSDAQAAALGAHFDRLKQDVRLQAGALRNVMQLTYPVAGTPSVSIIVVDAGDGVSLMPCLEAVLETTSYPHREILVVAPAAELPDAARLVRCDESNDLTARYRLGAEAASGDYLLFLDSRVELAQPDWLERLLGLASRTEVGAVAPRLLNADGRTIWRGPYLPGAASALFCGADIDAPGHLNRQWVEHNPSAVSLDCVLIGRALYERLGGVDLSMPDRECAAIDLCMRLRDSGQLIVWTPFVSALRHGGGSKAILDALGQQALSLRWSGKLADDPSYNRQLSLDGERLFLADEIYSAGWDVHFHERRRILVLPNVSSSMDLSLPLERLMDEGICLASTIPAEQRWPTPAELSRMAPDVIVYGMRAGEGFLDALRRHRYLLPETTAILLLDAPVRDDSLTPRYAAAALQAALKLVDRVIVPTEELRDVASRYCDDVHLLEEALDEARWQGLTVLRKVGKKARVGWMGGDENALDLAWLQAVVAETANEAEWVVLGDCPESLRGVVAEHHPFDLSSADYPLKLASLGLDLAVLPRLSQDGDAAGGVRLLEFGVLGVPVIRSAAAKAFPSAPAMQAGDEAAEWVEAIRARARDLEATGREGDALQGWVRSGHMLSQRLPMWSAALSR